MRTLITLFVLVLSSGSALAEGQRALVVFKSPEKFKAVQRAALMSPGVALQKFAEKNSPLSRAQVKVTTSLNHVGAVVVQTSSAQDLALLASSPEVAHVEKEIFYPAPPRVFNVDLGANVLARGASAVARPWGIDAVKAPEAWSTTKGAGARVLVLDTGVDRNHPAIAQNFEKGENFVCDPAKDANGNEIIGPDGEPACAENKPYPYADRNGHGTHVSGTIAGVEMNGGFAGVAPEARLLAGRVCADEGCSSVAIAKAINWGIQEKVNVISMSLGGMLSTPTQRMAISAAVRNGIIIVAASGNSGEDKVSYPAALSPVIAVGAVDSTLKRADFSQYGPELAIVAPGVAVNSSVPLGLGRESEVVLYVDGNPQKVPSVSFVGGKEILTPEVNQLVPAGLGKLEDFKNTDVRGKYALISRGEIRFSEKVVNAMNAGAAGVLFYNNEPGFIQGAVTDDGSVLPVGIFMIEQSVGLQLMNAIKNGSIVSASFNIIPKDYAEFDGTSMACPHVSGVVALMVSAKPSLNAAQAKEVLRRTATPLGPNSRNEYGAGLVNAAAAVREARAL